MQIQTTMRYHLTPIKMAPIEKMRSRAGEDVGKEILVHSYWEWNLVQPLKKPLWQFLQKLEIEPPHNPLIPLLSPYVKEVKTVS